VASLFSHPAVALAAFPWFLSLAGRRKILVAGALLTLLPDLDVIGFRFGIPYEDLFGHRGISHSLPAALLLSGLISALVARRSALKFLALWTYFALCLASHGLLDALTDGGEGVALLAPFSERRWFLPARPIKVSPLGTGRFFTSQG
jgi:inner membrane protein